MNLPRLRANWRTSLSGTAAALTGLLTIIAALPYELGAVATIIPPEWKANVAVAGAIATFLLRALNSVVTKDSAVVGNGTLNEPVRVPNRSGNVSVEPLLLALLLPIALGGCATDTHEDGTVPRRVDTAAIRGGLAAGAGAYQFHRHQQRPMHEQPAYQQRLYHQGQTIDPAPGVYPQVFTTYP